MIDCKGQSIRFDKWKVQILFYFIDFYSILSFQEIPFVNSLCSKIPNILLRMYSQFKPQKPLSTSKRLIKSKTKQLIRQNHQSPYKKIKEEIFKEYGKQDAAKTQKPHAKQLNSKQNIYYTSTCVQTDEQANGVVKCVNKRKSFINKNLYTNIAEARSSQSSISSISLKRKHFTDSQNYRAQKINKVNPERNAFVMERNISPKTNRSMKIKNISTKTSIKEIEQIRSSHQIESQKQQPSKKSAMKLVKDNTLKIAMKNMLQQLKSTRQQNSQLKDELIRIKSQQYYSLNREKVKQMVIDLEKEKELRKQVEKENFKLNEQNVKLKQQNSSYKKENYRMKRINAQMKEEITQIRQENIILRQRVNRDQQNSVSDDFSKD